MALVLLLASAGCECGVSAIADGGPDATVDAHGTPDCRDTPTILQPEDGARIASGPLAVWLSHRVAWAEVVVCERPGCERILTRFRVPRELRVSLGEPTPGPITLRVETPDCIGAERTFDVVAPRPAAVDVDGDGVHDLVGHAEGGRGWLYASSLDWAAPEPFVLDAAMGSDLVADVDVDVDGRTDLVAITTTAEIALSTRGASGFAPSVVLLGGALSSPMAAGDIDGDGGEDLVVRSGPCTIAMVLGGRVEPRIVDFPLDNVGCDASRAFQIAAVGAVQAHVFGDLLAFDPRSREVALYPGSSEGLSSFPVALVAGAAGEIERATSADLDGDGSRDLVFLLSDAGVRSVAVLYGEAGRFSGDRIATVAIEPGASMATALFDAGDLDGDGAGEVGVVAGGRESVLFDGPGRAPVAAHVGGDAEVDQLAPSGDLDGDGRNELLVVRGPTIEAVTVSATREPSVLRTFVPVPDASWVRVAAGTWRAP